MLPTKFAFVDLETTGTSVKRDRIIEIAIIRTENNKLVDSYHTLINPNIRVSSYIEDLTGISKYDILLAPSFRQVSFNIQNALEDYIFVSHNARFDYAFLRNEFSRLEKKFSKKQLCTVKLSRYLFPRYRRHDLDSIIKRHNICCKKRHRAYDDAKAIWDFFQLIQVKFDNNVLSKAISYVLKKPSIPININEKELDAIPESPGVYLFYSSDNTPLYIGKSKNVRERVLSHFSNDSYTSKEMHICQQIERIETVKTSGELGALFLEATLIKKLQPIYNRKLRNRKKFFVLKNAKNKHGYDTAILEIVNNIDVSEIETVLGVFRSKRQSVDFLVSIARKNNLCDKILGLQNTNKACFGYHLGRCFGACIRKESPLFYNARFSLAFSSEKIKTWPYKGPIILEEKNYLENTSEAFLIDRWCLLGKLKINEANQDFDITKDEYFFDYDIYKIIRSYLSKKNSLKIKTLLQTRKII